MQTERRLEQYKLKHLLHLEYSNKCEQWMSLTYQHYEPSIQLSLGIINLCNHRTCDSINLTILFD